MPPGEPPRNHHEEFEQYLRSVPNPRGRKLTFAEKCGIAWALHKGEKGAVVREAFGLSAATVSWLKHALDGTGKHYADLRTELRTLGAEPFKEKYYTPELHWRLQRIRLGLPRLDETQTDRAPIFAYDPRATKYLGPVEVVDKGEIVARGAITLHPGKTPPGFAFAFAETPDEHHGAESLRGAEDWEPFPSSSAAYDGFWAVNGLPSPRVKPGRRPK